RPRTTERYWAHLLYVSLLLSPLMLLPAYRRQASRLARLEGRPSPLALLQAVRRDCRSPFVLLHVAQAVALAVVRALIPILLGMRGLAFWLLSNLASWESLSLGTRVLAWNMALAVPLTTGVTVIGWWGARRARQGKRWLVPGLG
ncbi:MAG: hypothetical protein ACE5LU_28155, partial [Anaerolineae bacterium]